MYLLNYARTGEQLRRVCQVCHDALRPGGRFVGFNDNVRNPPGGTVSWKKYGLEKSCAPLPKEGDVVLYTVTNDDGRQFKFKNFFLTPETYREAFQAAGFQDFRWVADSLHPAQQSNLFWDDFMTNPPVLVGPADLGSFDEHQVYYVGTSELPDISITGRAIYPEDLAGRAGEGLAVVVLLDRERYELLQEEKQGFKPALAKILAEASASRVREEPEAEEDAETAALVRMTGIGSGGRYELKFVPDGDYILLANVVLDDGEILMAGSYGVEDLESGSAPLLVEGVSLTDVDVDLFHIGVDTVDAREVTVAGVDVKGGFLYFDDSDGDRVTVSVFPILGSILDLEGNLIEFSDLGVGSVVLVSGLMVVGEIVAFEIRVVSLPPSPEPPSPDFSGNGVVGLEDFFAFAEVYGSVDGDGIYQAKFDLSRNGSIGLEDFFIFAESFGMEVGTS